MDVDFVVLEEEVVFPVEGEWESMGTSMKKCATGSVETAVWLALVKSLA